MAVLRNREAAVRAELAVKQAELDRAKERLSRAHDHLLVLRVHLRRSLTDLREMLVSIYRSGSPDMLEVILSSRGFDDLVGRAEYLDRIQTQNEAVVSRVRDLRDQAQDTVHRLRAAKLQIKAVRDSIAAKERELARTRGAIESQQGALESVRGKRQAAVDEINSHIDRLSEVEDGIQQKIQEQIAAASGGIALPAGPLGAPSAAGLIWPVSGPITSGYGYRWGRLHEGIDIAVPEGTPIRAAASGTVDHRRLATRRLRQLHLHRPRRRPLHLLRPPVRLRGLRRGERQPGRDHRLYRQHRLEHRAAPPLRGADQRRLHGSARLPLAGAPPARPAGVEQ